MANYITEDDGTEAKRLAARWEKATPAAKKFATESLGKYAPVLPHVIAEIFDEGQKEVILMLGRAAVDERFKKGADSGNIQL